jgi:copper transport protein
VRRALLVAAFAALALPATASAHATLQATAPTFKQRLQVAPARVSLRFDQGVKVFPDSIQVLTSTGKLVSGTARPAASTLDVVVPVRRDLPAGGYTVRWRALSADGHTVAGVFTFGVRAPAPNVLQAFGASGPTRTEHVVRWLYFLGLALLIGGLTFRLVVVGGPLPARAEKRFFLLTGLGVVGVLEVGIAAFLLRAEDALQLPFSKLLYGDLSPIAGGTRFGQAFTAMTLGYALVAALVFLAWLTDRTFLLWPAFAIAVAFAAGLSLSGHSAADSGHGWASELADWVHLSAATIWVGGLVQLVAVVWPLAPERRRGAFLRFSRLATVCIALVLSAGVYLSILRLPHVHDLWSAGYGRVLLVKLGLVMVALAWGATHHFVARPRLEQGPSERVVGWLPRSLAAESAIGMAVLLAAAVLVDSKPPARPAPAPPVASNVHR